MSTATASAIQTAATAATTPSTTAINDDANATTHFLSRSDRVKSVDFHPTQPWLLTALHTGSIEIWNTHTHALVKTLQVSTTPVRTARFVARDNKNWIVTGADDAMVRVFDVDTNALVASFKAHDDYVRFVDVHPSKPFVLTCSDDKTIKVWDWEREWACVQVFEGHDHYVMQAKFNAADPNLIASASLDHSVRVWSLTSGGGASIATLTGHTTGVNCVDFFTGASSSTGAGANTATATYILSGSDDATVKVWDLATKTVLQTLVGHTKNVAAVLKHPLLPLIVSASEDDTVRTWSAATFHAESVLSYDLCRAWCLSALPGSSSIAIGYDHGSVVVDLAPAGGAGGQVTGVVTRAGAARPARL